MSINYRLSKIVSCKDSVQSYPHFIEFEYNESLVPIDHDETALKNCLAIDICLVFLWTK